MSGALPAGLDEAPKLAPGAVERIKRHIRNLGDPDEKVAIRAERLLVRYGDRALDYLCEATRDEDPQRRFRAAWALGHIGNPRAYKAVLKLTQDADETVSYEALMALGVLGDPRAIDPLITVLRERARDEGPCASAAAMALVRIGQPAVPALTALLDDPDAAVRILAASALGGIGSEEAVIPLVTLMQDCNEWVRIAAIEALGEIGGIRSLALIEAYLEDPVPEVRETADFWCKEILRTLPRSPASAPAAR